MAEPIYDWWGWQAETEMENDDDRQNVHFLTIVEHGEEYAVIMHRTCPDENGVEKYPLDGPYAREKLKRAQRIVDALNATAKED